MITLCNLLAVILFKLAHLCLNAFNLVQSHVVNSNKSARQITPSKTSVSCHVKPFLSYIKEFSHNVCIKRRIRPRPCGYISIIITMPSRDFTSIEIVKSPVCLTCPCRYMIFYIIILKVGKFHQPTEKC